MNVRIRFGLVLLALLAVATRAQAQSQASKLPDGVTQAMIDDGKKIFTSSGLCFACHGMDAKGAIGPNLTDQEWLHSKGTYPEIVAQVIKGVPQAESKSGTVMPPKGGSSITDDQVKAVSAYVWSLSHTGS